MSLAIEEAIRRVLDHGRSQKQYMVAPAGDFRALAGTCTSEFDHPVQANGGWAPVLRDPAYEREMRRLFDNAELDP